MFVFCVLILLAGAFYETEARKYELASYNGYPQCISYPEDHCVLEGGAKQLCSHFTRLSFDWETKTCVTIYWNDYCGYPGEGPNLFITEKRCSSTCSGWSD